MKTTLALSLLIAATAMLPLPASAEVERSGEQVVQYQCVICHGPGTGGAPRIGDGKAWKSRAAGGVDRLVRSALDGLRGMPPNGGAAGLSEAELRAAIRYMLEKSGAAKD